MATCTLASKAGCGSPYFSLSYRSFLQGSLIKDKEWGGWLNLWQPAETPLTSLTFQIIGAYSRERLSAGFFQ